MDSLDSLPFDRTRQQSPQEVDVLDRYFKEPSVAKASRGSEFKIVVAATVIFMILSISYFDNFLDMLPHSGSPMIKYALKALIFFSILYIAIIMLG